MYLKNRVGCVVADDGVRMCCRVVEILGHLFMVCLVGLACVLAMPKRVWRIVESTALP